MGLTINFPDKTDGICEGAYMIMETAPSNKTKSGQIQLLVWKNQESRDSHKDTIGKLSLPLKKDAEVLEPVFNEETKEMEQVKVKRPGEQWREVLNEETKEMEKKYVKTLNYDDFAWKDAETQHAKIKELKIKVDGVIVDLSKAVDVLD